MPDAMPEEPTPGKTPGETPSETPAAEPAPPVNSFSIEPSPQPWLGLDLRNPELMVDLFNQAAHLNRTSKMRKGATVYLPAAGTVVMTGDIHDHGPNLNRILNLAKIHESPSNHVILHEVIHGESFVNNCDLSVRMLAKIAALKVAFPDQVHLLQSNHELAQYRGDGILKGNVSVVKAFDDGLDYIYNDNAEPVRKAVRAFIRTYPLAVRAPKGILFIHSLPGARQMEKFDPGVLDRELTDKDLEPGGDGYVLVWGRYQSQELCDKLAQAWGVDVFVCGHQPAEMGYELMTRTLMILASNHDHGMALPLDLGRRYDMDKLVESLVPLAAMPG
ncbi:MAG: metallophosphoesterase [Phycisphaeraceae bacterium]